MLVLLAVVNSNSSAHSSHTPTHGIGCLFDLSVFYEIVCIERAFVMLQQ